MVQPHLDLKYFVPFKIVADIILFSLFFRENKTTHVMYVAPKWNGYIKYIKYFLSIIFREFTWHAKPHFLWMSSAAVETGALLKNIFVHFRVKWFQRILVYIPYLPVSQIFGRPIFLPYLSKIWTSLDMSKNSWMSGKQCRLWSDDRRAQNNKIYDGCRDSSECDHF